MKESIDCGNLCVEYRSNEYKNMGDNVTVSACCGPLVWVQSSRSPNVWRASLCSIKSFLTKRIFNLKNGLQGLKGTIRKVQYFWSVLVSSAAVQLLPRTRAINREHTFKLVGEKSSGPSLLLSGAICNVKILPGGRTLSLELPQGSKATIREVKNIIRLKESIDCDDLCLEHRVNEYKKLGDDVTVDACCGPLVWVQSSTSSGLRRASMRNFKILLSNPIFNALQGLKATTIRNEQSSRSWHLSNERYCNPSEQKFNPALVLDAENPMAAIVRMDSYRDCEPKLSLVLDRKNNLQKDLSNLARRLVPMRDEINRLQMDVTELQCEKVELEQNVAELRDEIQGRLFLQDELHTVRSELGQERERRLCTICLDRPRDTLILSCLHLHFCSQCLEQHQKWSNTCPTCRGFINGKLVCNLTIS